MDGANTVAIMFRTIAISSK